MSKLYFILDTYIKRELEDIAQDSNIPYKDLLYNYEYRKRNIQKCYGNDYLGRESHILVNAFNGTKTYIRYLKNLDKYE